jgi:hypothetical protein
MPKSVCWLYASESLIGGDVDKEIDAIVSWSKEHNARLCVGGALIFTGKRFSQYIEGPDHAVRALRAAIAADPRHTAVTTLAEGPLRARRFKNWSLVYSGKAPFMERSIVLALPRSGVPTPGASERLIGLMTEFERQEGESISVPAVV